MKKFLEILNSKPVIGALIFIMLSLATVIAGDVIVKEGDSYFDGNVGIGTTSPGEKLDVGNTTASGSIRLSAPSSSVSNIDFFDGSISGRIQYNHQTDEMDFLTAGSTRLRIKSDGNVGIGTTNPDQKLTIGSGTTTGNKAIHIEDHDDAYIWLESDEDNSGEDDNPWIRFSQDNQLVDTIIGHVGANNVDPSNAAYTGTLNNAFLIGVRLDTAADLQFGTNKIVRMTIDNTGDVGIGTTTPSYPLEVNGDVSDISIYASKNISATGYITRTSVFDKSKNVWDYVKDASYYVLDGMIDHKKFYGYAGIFNVTDYSRPLNEPYTIEVCDEVIIENETKQECYNKTEYRMTYPYIKEEEGISLDAEINLLRQAVYEMSQELCTYNDKYSWC